MKLLAIETATEACSAALWVEGTVHERFEVAPRRHGELILPMVEALLGEAQLTLSELDALAFGRGPGAFTGVRIATGIVQGLALGAEIPVVPVSTLAALALGAMRAQGATQVLAALDARMDEVYWGAYIASGEGVRLIGTEQVGAASVIAARFVANDAVTGQGLGAGDGGRTWLGVGSGWQVHGEALGAPLATVLCASDATCLPHAREIARLGVEGFAGGQGVAAEFALPMYLRNDVAWKRPVPVTGAASP